MTAAQIHRRFRPAPAVLVFGLAIHAGSSVVFASDDGEPGLDEIVVTSQRRAQNLLSHAGNVERLAQDELARIRHQHLHELLNRVSGVWLSRGSGQENLTAIRSPVLTGAGSCGAFLTLEDGIPSRPAGFCNVNQLIEINTEQAQSIEVIRGPGSALYGSNALHGIINVVMPSPGEPVVDALGVEVGANDYYRLRAQIPFRTDSALRASVIVADDGGFRDESGYRQAKGHLKYRTAAFGGELTGALSLSDLEQETAGFIVGRDAYKDAALKRSNPNPEAFRDASSQRLYGLWTGDFERFFADVRPYLRHSDMRFLQHFLPGQPLEENGHYSMGIMTAFTFDLENSSIVAGLDLEWSDVFLKETQFQATQGSPFLVETRPVGKHYDFEVESAAVAPFVQFEFPLNSRLTVSAGLRAEYIRYDYDNRMRDGNTRDDGTACGFGGCLYTRPADRADAFTNLAPKFAATYLLGPDAALYASLARGFRAPQMTELYRLQSGQQVADLDSERLDSVELGFRVRRKPWSVDASIFAMKKRDSVFRDADGFNVSGARSRHRGLEFAFDWQLTERWRLEVAATYALHEYDFDLVAARGETFVSGHDVDTAPRWLANAELLFDPVDVLSAGLQWTTVGAYYLDAENRFEYPGHDIANLHATLRLDRGFALSARLNNVADSDIADRADYAFGNYRYFPGRGRELFVELRYTPDALRR